MQPVIVYVALDEHSPAIGPLEFHGTSEFVWRCHGSGAISRFPVWRVNEWLQSLPGKCDNTCAKAGLCQAPTKLSGMVPYARNDSAEDKNFPRASGASS